MPVDLNVLQALDFTYYLLLTTYYPPPPPPPPSPSPSPIAVPIPIATHIPMPITIPMPIVRLPPQCLNPLPLSPTSSSLCIALPCLAQTSCLAMFAEILYCPVHLHGQCPSRCTAQCRLHRSVRVGFGAPAGSAGGAMAGCSFAAWSASESGRDLSWQRLEDKALGGEGEGITHREAFLIYRLLLVHQ